MSVKNKLLLLNCFTIYFFQSNNYIVKNNQIDKYKVVINNG